MAIIKPYVTVCGRIDLRGLEGVTIYTRGGTPIAVPTFTGTEGVYDDIFDLAHSRGSSATALLALSRVDLSSALQALWAPTAYITINTNDRFEIVGPASFSVDPSTSNPIFGFPAAGVAATDNGDGTWSARATMDFERGVVSGAQLTVNPGVPFQIPVSATYRAQSVIVLTRRRGRTAVPDGDALGPYDVADAAGATCLEAVDNAAVDPALTRIRHYIDDEGFYTMVWPDGIGISSVTWATTEDARTVQAVLGFAGDEESIATGGLVVLRASKQPAYATTTRRPWRRAPVPTGGERTEAKRLVQGGAAVNHVAAWTDYTFDLWLDGPDSPLGFDVVDHYLSMRDGGADTSLSRMPKGKPITIVVGRDMRRYIRPSDVNVDRPAASTLYSSKLCSGTWRVIRSPEDSEGLTISYDESLRRQYWAQVSLRVGPRRVGA